MQLTQALKLFPPLAIIYFSSAAYLIGLPFFSSELAGNFFVLSQCLAMGCFILFRNSYVNLISILPWTIFIYLSLLIFDIFSIIYFGYKAILIIHVYTGMLSFLVFLLYYIISNMSKSKIVSVEKFMIFAMPSIILGVSVYFSIWEGRGEQFLAPLIQLQKSFIPMLGFAILSSWALCFLVGKITQHLKTYQ